MDKNKPTYAFDNSPSKNESNIIHEVFDYFFINLKNVKYEVLIVNDYSGDDTFDKFKNYNEKKF